jgi:glycosyltransferase involved in cell wall biosynthesis
MVSDFYPPMVGGLERAVADLSHELAERGNDVAVATLWHDGLPREEREGGVAVHRMDGTLQHFPLIFAESHRRFHPPVPDPVTTRQLRRLVEQYKPDIIHGHSWMMLSALPLRRRLRFGTVVTLHHYGLLCPKTTLLFNEQSLCQYHLSRHCLTCAPQIYGTVKGVLTTAGLRIGRTLYRKVDEFVAVSSSVAERHYCDGVVERTRITTVPNFVRGDILRRPLEPHLPGLPEEYILFVGALTHQKGIHSLLDAYVQLDTDLPLVLIGPHRPGTPQTFPTGVTVLSDLPHADVIRAMDHARFVVSPSLVPETFGLVNVEAMARGKAVIASRLGGALDIVEDGVSGLLVTPGDVGALATAMRTLTCAPDLASRMGRAGAIRCQASFSANSVVPHILGIYEKACRAAHSRVGARK